MLRSTVPMTYVAQNVQAMTYVAQNVQTSRIVQEGYTQFGQKGGRVDAFKILSACREDIAEVKSSKMMGSMAFLDTLYNDHGEIDEKHYDDLGIEGHHGEAECTKEKDNL